MHRPGSPKLNPKTRAICLRPPETWQTRARLRMAWWESSRRGVIIKNPGERQNLKEILNR